MIKKLQIILDLCKEIIGVLLPFSEFGVNKMTQYLYSTQNIYKRKQYIKLSIEASPAAVGVGAVTFFPPSMSP